MASFDFNPEHVAYFEAEGWRAYYNRDWPRLLRLVVSLCQEQFHIPFPQSLLAAYYVTRAARAWAPLEHDEALVRAYYERFYRLAARYSGLRLDPTQAGALELRYNDIHRRLVGQTEKRAFVETMVELHSAVFGIRPEQARESAVWRVRANNLVDGITGGRSTDIEADWRQIKEALVACYRSIRRAMHEPATRTNVAVSSWVRAPLESAAHVAAVSAPTSMAAE